MTVAISTREWISRMTLRSSTRLSSTRRSVTYAARAAERRCAGAKPSRRPMKRIFDPIHHFIELSRAEAYVLDLPAMQRLRRLRQLGLAYLAFPSAEHSRFTHVLGAMAVGTQAFDEVARHGAEFFSDA